MISIIVVLNMSLAGCSNNNNIMEQDLNNFSLVSLPREKKRKKKLVHRLVQFILKKEDEEEEENLKILRLIRPPRYKPKPLGQIVAETGYSAKEVQAILPSIQARMSKWYF